jgi:hypothetical protein
MDGSPLFDCPGQLIARRGGWDSLTSQSLVCREDRVRCGSGISFAFAFRFPAFPIFRLPVLPAAPAVTFARLWRARGNQIDSDYSEESLLCLGAEPEGLIPVKGSGQSLAFISKALAPVPAAAGHLMKTPSPRSLRLALPLCAIGALAVGFLPACSKSDQHNTTAAIKDTYEDSKAAMARTWDNAKDYTFDKRDSFRADAKSLDAKMDVHLSEVRANYSDAKASASRKAAMAELKTSETDFKAKCAALGDATAATWDSAKKNTMLSWDRLQAAYYKARAS